MIGAPASMTRAAKIGYALLLFGFASQILLGHLIALGLDGPLMAWHQDRVAIALWGSEQFGPAVAAYRAWISALLGGTMISYAWAMLWIVAVPLRRGERWAAWAIAVATGHWFILDTSLSAYHGVWVNVGFNCAALTLIAVPLGLMVPWLRSR